MPTIPQYSAPQVAVQPVKPPSFDVRPSDQTGAGSKQIEQLGQAAVQASSGLSAVAQHLQQQEDADAVFRAETALKADLAKFHESVKERRGVNAWNVTKEAEAWWTDTQRKHGEGLTRDTQRRLYEQSATRLRLGSLEGVANHELAQRRESVTESSKQSIIASINLAAANFDEPGVITQAKDDIVRRHSAVAALNGFDAQTRDTMIARSISDMHAQVLQNIARTRPQAAAAYFEMNRQEINGSLHAELGKLAQDAAADAKAQTAADAAWTALRPENDLAPTDRAAIENRVRELTGDDGHARRLALADVRERIAAHEASARERSEANLARVLDVVASGGGIGQVKSMPEYALLSGAHRDKVVNHILQVEHSRLTRAATIESIQERREARIDRAIDREERRRERDGMARYFELSDPDKLMGMSRDQVRALQFDIGVGNTNHLLQRYDAIKKGGEKKLAEARIDKQDFDSIAQEFGLRPFEKTKSEDDKIALNELQNRVEQAIDIAQRGKGKDLTRDEKNQIMRRELSAKVTLDRPFWFDAKDKPFATMTPDERKRAYVTVDGKDHFVRDVPDYGRIENGLRARGMDSSPEAVIRFHLQTKTTTPAR